MSCKKCLQHIYGNDLCAECDGDCARRFHAKCVGLGEDTIKVLSQNVLWICDECLVQYRKNSMEKQHGVTPVRDSTVIEDDLADLKCKVDGILDTLSSITTKQSSTTLWHSTPVSSSKLLNGTNADNINASVLEKEKYTNAERSDTFSLLLTNIDCRVSEQEIYDLVIRCLDVPRTDCIRVTKLVPKYRESKDFDFISFKVTLSECWKSTAMDPSTWPCGLMYREFVQRKNVWKPDV